jgi:hypothetical protein
VLFLVVGVVLARSRAATLTDEEAQSRQIYNEILAEHARWWVILKLLAGTLLLLAGAAVLFAPTYHFTWTLLVAGTLGVLLGLGGLVHVCLTPKGERYVAAARERERQLQLSLSAMAKDKTSAVDS